MSVSVGLISISLSIKQSEASDQERLTFLMELKSEVEAGEVKD